MKNITLFTVISSLLASIASTSILATEESASISNKQKAIAVLNSIETGDPSAIAYINPTKYTQHNLGVGDGLAGFGEVMKMLPKGSAKANVVRSFQDGNYVFTHTDYNFFGPKVGFDVFRFEDGLIVEHWDNLTEKASSLNPSGRSQLDGEVSVTDLDKTQENKALVADFIDTILIKGEFNKVTQYISSETYLQHNTQVADGLNGLNSALKEMAEKGVYMVYKTNHAILGEGNFVLAISEGTFANNTVTYYDLFRVDGGKIVEHWDVIEPLLNKDEWKNSNGKFGFENDYVVEVATFKLNESVNPETFKLLDQKVESSHVSKQPGFISRTSGLTADNYWRVIVHWRSMEDAGASMASFMEAPAAQNFMKAADVSTMTMRRYYQLAD